jgi:hypothetical protein
VALESTRDQLQLFNFQYKTMNFPLAEVIRVSESKMNLAYPR